MSERVIRIGCAAGFWGDSALAAAQLVRRASLDYLVFDYLAEVTMSIMARARAKDPAQGYATDFVASTMPEILRDIAERRVKVVCNAGGVNPVACQQALSHLAAESGVPLRIAAVLGDDLMPRLEELRRRDVREMFTGEPLPARLLSANAYLGALSIKAALGAGADVVVTGRCVDSALVLGPLMHEFGWREDDYDRLAAGSLAGHIVECGAQATGGLYTDWRQVPRWDDIGYPIVECEADGGFTVTKPAGTGGLVTPGTVAEQMLYEIGDPAAYVLPDAVSDFSGVAMAATGPDRVRVTGARGRAPSDSYKVSATHADGYRLSLTLTVLGIDAAAKARATGEALLARTRRAFAERGLGDYRAVRVEALGAEDAYGPHARVRATREAVLRLAVWHDRREALDLLAREAASPVTSMAPGTTGYIGGRPPVQTVMRLFSFLVSKREVAVEVSLDGRTLGVPVPPGQRWVPPPLPLPRGELPHAGPTVMLPLARLAHGRSGDKGDSANIGVIARRPEFLPVLRAALTEAVVADYFRHLVAGPVTRYEVPGIDAFNFVLERALGGGGAVSLRNDPQGKGYAQMLLDLEIPVPVDLARSLDA